MADRPSAQAAQPGPPEDPNSPRRPRRNRGIWRDDLTRANRKIIIPPAEETNAILGTSSWSDDDSKAERVTFVIPQGIPTGWVLTTQGGAATWAPPTGGDGETPPPATGMVFTSTTVDLGPMATTEETFTVAHPGAIPGRPVMVASLQVGAGRGASENEMDNPVVNGWVPAPGQVAFRVRGDEGDIHGAYIITYAILET